MRILVDEMPKEASECLFVNMNVYGDVNCDIMGGHKCYMDFGVACPFLKKFEQVKDDCK